MAGRHSFQNRKEQRRKEAEERNAAFAKLTPTQKLELLEKRGIFSGKQYNKLLILIQNNKKS